jgi:hypothetical protein
LAFTTIQGSGATDATSFVGTAGVDSVLVLNPTTTTAASGGNYVEAQASGDLVTFNSFTTAVTGGTTVFGGQGNDVITATGNTIVGGYINGNKDVDTIGDATTSFNNVQVYGGQGADVINALNVSGGFINGNKNADQITTAATGTVTGAIYGGQGTDNITISGNAVGAVVQGNLDTDVITVNGAASQIQSSSFNGNQGDDQLTWNVTTTTVANNNTVYGGAGNDTLTAAATATEEIVLSGDNGNDTITKGANGQNDTLLGGAGTDTITSNTGTNRIEGGAGADNITETGGTDTFVQAAGSSNAATASTVAAGVGGNLAAADTITIDADQITGFDAGDFVDFSTTTIGDANLVGSGTTSAGINIVYGAYNAATNVFTVANAYILGNAAANDALAFTSAAGINLSSASAAFGSDAVVFQGLGAALAAGNFV